MKFNLEETVTGAEIRDGAVLLEYPARELTSILLAFGAANAEPDAFVQEGETVCLGVFPQGELPADLLAHKTGDAFRLTLLGSRIAPGKGLSDLLLRSLSEAGIPVSLPSYRASGIACYLPAAEKERVLALLEKIFGIRAV